MKDTPHKTKADGIAEYYAARAPVFDLTAGYLDPVAEKLREPIKARYRDYFAGCDVLEVACGTGYWTEVVARTAKSIYATDINPASIAAAKERCSSFTNVTLAVADAYTLDGVPVGFDAAFAHYWLSHVPKDRLAGFFAALHAKLVPGAIVLVADQLPYDYSPRRTDADGDVIDTRTLPDGGRFEIVKNFPTEEELAAALGGSAEDIAFTEHPVEEDWELVYTFTGV